MKGALLIVDDEATFRASLTRLLEKDGHIVVTAGSVKEGLERFATSRPDAILLDYLLPDGDGVALLAKIREADTNVPVILMTAFGSIETAVAAMKGGATDYVTKSADVIAEIRLKVSQALRISNLAEEVEYRRRAQDGSHTEIVGRSQVLLAILRRTTEVAKSPDTTVLVRGESGTGKELIARAIHERTTGRNAPFVAIDCAAIPRELLESELFGHERGAFSGADRTKRGMFELARAGTILLDEIGELAPALQVKLLRVLEERQFRRVGGERDLEVNARVIGATNRDLAAMVQRGEFREDLFYRLSVFEIVLPPLRERASDVLELAEHFLKGFARKLGKTVDGFAPDAEDFLRGYHFPGNVRELRNMLERALIMLQGTMIDAKLLTPLSIHQTASPKPSSSPRTLVLTMGEHSLPAVERMMVERAMLLSDGNKKRAADLLGISRYALLRRLEKYALSAEATTEDEARNRPLPS